MTKIGRKVHTSFNQHEGSGDHLFRNSSGLESSACDSERFPLRRRRRRAAAPSTPRNPHIPCRPARHDRPKSGRGVQSVSGSAAAGRSGRRQHPGARCSLIYTINRRACLGRSPLLHGSRAHGHLFLITFTNGKGFWLGMAKQLVICELLNMQKDISDAVERCGRACVRGPQKQRPQPKVICLNNDPGIYFVVMVWC